MKYLLVATMALALAACGSAGEEEGASAGATSDFRAAAGADAPVKAVQDSPGTPVAQLQFLIDTRPLVGKPFQVRLIATAASAVSQLHLTADSESLLVDAASADLDLALDDSGAGSSRTYTATHDLMVLGKQTGLAVVSVHLSTGPDSAETVYSIPLLVMEAEPAGTVPATASDKPDPAAKADNGQP